METNPSTAPMNADKPMPAKDAAPFEEWYQNLPSMLKNPCLTTNCIKEGYRLAWNAAVLGCPYTVSESPLPQPVTDCNQLNPESPLPVQEQDGNKEAVDPRIEDLVMLVRRMVVRLTARDDAEHDPKSHKLADAAMDYLRRKGLASGADILRESVPEPQQSVREPQDGLCGELIVPERRCNLPKGHPTDGGFGARHEWDSTRVAPQLPVPDGGTE